MPTLTQDITQALTNALKSGLDEFDIHYPGEKGNRQPVHTVYGGAHLFKADTASRLGSLALRSFETYAPDAATFGKALGLEESLSNTIYEKVSAKLKREPVEDFRIDFEDGYGTRSDDEEDAHAASAAREVAKGLQNGTLPPFIGIRIKAFSGEAHQRSIRTLDLFLTSMLEATGGRLPENFVITLPKVVLPVQIATLADIFDFLESRLNLPGGILKMEMMIETTQSILSNTGDVILPQLLAAARGRCVAAHFGAYDYTASCNITSAYQDMLHPACDFARHIMQVAFSGTGISLSDGATNIMPVGPHKGELTAEQEAENREVVYRAWKLHYKHVRYSLANGFYQSWDLHPAQLPARYAAVYAFFLEGLSAASERLRNFIAKAARATLVGDVFDDAATGQGLLNFFLRAINCRAILEQDAQNLTGLSLDELRSGSFAKILKHRKG